MADASQLRYARARRLLPQRRRHSLVRQFQTRTPHAQIISRKRAEVDLTEPAAVDETYAMAKRQIKLLVVSEIELLGWPRSSKPAFASRQKSSCPVRPRRSAPACICHESISHVF